jgi:phosphoribosylamine---glycine ligase
VATASKKLQDIVIETDERCAAAVVAVSGGYPGDYPTEIPVQGLDEDPLENSLVFQSGTRQLNDEVVTNGGRVLVVTSFGESIAEAAEQSNYMMDQLYFEGMYFRSDIGYEFSEQPQ